MEVYRDGKSEVALFAGKKYRRYPESARRNDRVYFKRTVKTGTNEYLHVAIYESVYGAVPDGCHVHHKDGDPFNNSIDNLGCLEGAEHLSLHAKEYHATHGEAVQRNLDSIRPLTKQWHASDAGKQWHSEHAKAVFGNREMVTAVCQHCGKSYEVDALSAKGGARFCSNRCKTASRVASGVDNEERVCVMCGRPFVANKYRKKATCSVSCSRSLRSRSRKYT